jgi:hypothetical protein
VVAQVKIADLEQRDGVWRATVTLPTPPDGVTFHVDRRYGSWRITPKREGRGYLPVLPEVAAALQARVRKLERQHG